MPDHLWVPASVRAFVRELADKEVRKAINLAIISLVDDPLPLTLGYSKSTETR